MTPLPWRWRRECSRQCDRTDARPATSRLEVISRRARINATHTLLARASKSLGAPLCSRAPEVQLRPPAEHARLVTHQLLRVPARSLAEHPRSNAVRRPGTLTLVAQQA